MDYVKRLREKIGKQAIILNGSCVIFLNEKGEVLLQQRQEKRKRWGLLGGLMELGESTKETALREIQEETNWQLMTTDLTLFDVYSGKKYFVVADNGDEFYVVTTVYFTTKIPTTPPFLNQESLQLKWFTQDNLPKNIAGSYEEILQDFFHKSSDLLLT